MGNYNKTEGQRRKCLNWKDHSNQLGKGMKIYSVKSWFLFGNIYYKISVLIGTETNWLLNLENPDLDIKFRCNTTRNGSNIIFTGK